MGLLGNVGPKATGEDEGFVLYSKGRFESTEPDKLKHKLASEYTRLVQENVMHDFSIVFDGDKHEVLLSWRPVK